VTARLSPELAVLLTQIADACAAREPPGGMRTRVIAVDGPGGAGKSTFAEQLAAALGGCQIVHTDDFASWDDPVDWWPRLIEQVLEPLTRGERAEFDPSLWTPGLVREPIEVVPAEFLVLEGVTASRDAFRPYLTYTVWIDAPDEVRLRRGVERDGEEARAQWIAWMAEEDRYRERERPDARADLVVSGDRGLWA
jgi:uridine kinase